ncbi:MAG: hypothetical protein CSB13_03660 [Chloroflexi bacterium]|nr:MAG: hypothetical protein CSB13_03660 [Chloroflexota bacterium]
MLKGFKGSNRRFLWAATAVLLLAALFRLVALHDVPPGLSQDEVLNADIVSFIRGGYHAFFFREGYGHEPLYHYWSVPFQVLLGDNVLSIRLPAVTLGLFLIALTMRWSKREFGSVTAVMTGLFLAVSWWPIIFSRVGLRPILEPVLLLMMAWFWPKRPFLAGLFLGLSLYSYTGARVVFLIPGLMLVYHLLLKKWLMPSTTGRFSSGKAALLALMTALVVALPLFVTLHLDPTLQQRVAQLLGPLDALRTGDPWPILQTTLATFGIFGVTGDPRWTYSIPDRPLFTGVTAVFFLSGLGIALWRWRQPRYAGVLIWLFVGLIPSAITPQAPSTVRLVGALPFVYLLPALSLHDLHRRLWFSAKGVRRQWGQRLFWGGVFLIVLLASGRTIRDGFVRWPQAQETRWQHYQTIFKEIGEHIGASESELPIVMTDGFFEPIDRDSFRRNLGYDPEARWVQTGSEVAGAIVFPLGGSARFFVPEFAAPHSMLLAQAGIPAEPVFRSAGQPSFAEYLLPTEIKAFSETTDVLFSDRISLIGYETLPNSDLSGVTLFTMWLVKRPLPTDLATFAHVINENGDPVAQYDGLDAAPQTLFPGDIIIQRHPLPDSEHWGGDTYTVRLGLYQRSDNVRWQPDGYPTDYYTINLPHFDD